MYAFLPVVIYTVSVIPDIWRETVSKPQLPWCVALDAFLNAHFYTWPRFPHLSFVFELNCRSTHTIRVMVSNDICRPPSRGTSDVSILRSGRRCRLLVPSHYFRLTSSNELVSAEFGVQLHSSVFQARPCTTFLRLPCAAAEGIYDS